MLRKTLSVLALLAVGGLSGAYFVGKSGADRVPIYLASSSSVQAAANTESGFAPVVRKATPAVVNISTSKVVRSPVARGGRSPMPFDDPILRDFFGGRMPPGSGAPRDRRENSLGSGVIVSPEGYVLTNNHVVEAATEIKVVLSDRREFKAKLVGGDPMSDIAVLKLDQKNLPVLPLSDSSKVQVGEFALAIGNPFGLSQTVTMGIISGVGRGGLGIEEIEDFIQTDAAINPGNSGGALINANGDLIGINTAILSGTGGNQGIGFAVPVNLARNVMDQIIKTGKVTRGWIGVGIQEVTPSMAKAFGLPSARGIAVTEVAPDSPAIRAGIQVGDVIVAVNGKEVNEANSLRNMIATTPPNSPVRLKILRSGQEREVSLKLGELPVDQKADRRGTPGEPEGILEGVDVEPLTPEIARQLGVPSNVKGLIVSDVEPSSKAAAAGLRRGDVITEVNRKPVANISDLANGVRQSAGQTVLLLVQRGGGTRFIAIEP